LGKTFGTGCNPGIRGGNEEERGTRGGRGFDVKMGKKIL